MMEDSLSKKTVLVTGSDGFIGKNLCIRLLENQNINVIRFTRKNKFSELEKLLSGVDFIFHAAGVNRSESADEFAKGNIYLTEALCEAVSNLFLCKKVCIPIVFCSSTQAGDKTPYGESKLSCEMSLSNLYQKFGIPIYVFRLPNVFGKWCKPNYNSVVATFCFNIARDLPIKIDDPSSKLTLLYVDDLVDHFIRVLDGLIPDIISNTQNTITPQYDITVGELAEVILSFHKDRTATKIARVGSGLVRALYATYMSNIPIKNLTYELRPHSDKRGLFVEMLRTPDSGQFSYFTIACGVTRGSHYHHTKTEKFLIVSGDVKMRFRHLITGETAEFFATGKYPQVIDTIPGWVHDITNVGPIEAIVMLWSSENFDQNSPDCIPCEV